MALIVVTFVALLGAGYVNLTSSLARKSAAVTDQQQAFYLAEAGLAESFHAVRMGRSGQVASDDDPARFGQGLLWVDAVDQADGSVRLECTALSGTAARTLALVVEPVDLTLGFFADEDLLVDSVVFTDGWNSAEATYEEATGGGLPTREALKTYADWLQSIIGNGTFDKVVVESDIDPTIVYSGKLAKLSVAELEELAVWQPAIRLGYPVGHDPAGPVESYAGDSGSGGGDSVAAPVVSVLGPTTGSGGRLGSNGDVHFAVPAGDTAEVWGDVLPGPSGRVTGLDNVSVSGSTAPRGGRVELPMVEVPLVAWQAPVRHDDLLPMLIASGESGHERIEVAPEAELVIRGPATVVIGALVLEPTAILTLDTRAGEVSLFVTGELDLQPGSTVSTSGEVPADTTVQVSATAGDPLDPAVKLEATSQFHGTVYAPAADVRIGSDFEVYGGVVARRLDVAPGARLHVDRAGKAGSALPRIVGWRVSEVPAAVRELNGDPFRALGLDPAALRNLSDAHDLGIVEMDLDYIDLYGAERSFSGLECDFDWDVVGKVVRVERQATRDKADEPVDAPAAEPPADDALDPTHVLRPEVEDALTNLDGTDLKDALQARTPLTADEAVAVLESLKISESDTKSLLQASSPLAPIPLSMLLTDGKDIGSTHIGDLLMAASPLPPEVLAEVQANRLQRLDSTDLTRVLRANS